MRRRVLIFIAACFYYSGLVKLACWWTQRLGHRLIILNYHSASEGDLRSHLLYLRHHYRVLHLEPALEELYTLSKVERKRYDRRTALVLTFDDGYHDNYTHGFALARELQVPITIFLIPGYIESGDCFWWLEGRRLLEQLRVGEEAIAGRGSHAEYPVEQSVSAQAIDTYLYRARSVAEREAFLLSARKLPAVSPPVAQKKAALPLTWVEVQEMEESGWVSFGAHTMHHPILAYLTDSAEVEYEVRECRLKLEQQLGHPVRTFAYPVGQTQHIGDDVLRAVQQAGYDWALTTMYGFNTPRSDPYLLRRIEVDVSQHWLVVAAETAGLWGFLSRLRWLPLIRKYFTNAAGGNR